MANRLACKTHCVIVCYASSNLIRSVEGGRADDQRINIRANSLLSGCPEIEADVESGLHGGVDPVYCHRRTNNLGVPTRLHKCMCHVTYATGERSAADDESYYRHRSSLSVKDTGTYR